MFVFFQDYQRHIAVLKESLCAKEDHYNMLQADVSVFFLYFIQPESVEKSRLHRHFNWVCLQKKKKFFKDFPHISISK